MRIKFLLTVLFSILNFLLTGSNNFSQNNKNTLDKVITGADLLLSENLRLIEGKRIGVVSNHTGILSNGKHLVDTLNSLSNLKVAALFGPEHGVRGDSPAGLKIEHGVDSKTNIPVYSLYGKDKKPTQEMLRDVDILIFDIQDIGARFYTYISTLFYSIQAAAENNIPIIILDRPNPISGEWVDGPVCKEDQFSFVGIAPIPIMHGMTVGELAKLFTGERYIGKNLHADMTVIKMKNWSREEFFDQTGLKWMKPSPNIPDLETAIVYPGTCLIEGTNVSEGRGTKEPFLTIGAPFVLPIELIDKLESLGIAGLKLSPVSFTPIDIPEMAKNPKHKNEECYGIQIKVTDRQKFEPVKFGIKLLYALNNLYPNQFKIKEASFNRLVGDSSITEKIKSGESAEKIIGLWQNELNQFKKIKNKYLLY